MISFNEKDLVMYTKDFNTFTDDILSIFWLIGTFCNFDCFYCSAQPRSKTLTKEPLIYDIIKFIMGLPNKTIIIKIAGGEPTTFNNLSKYIAEISNIAESTGKNITIDILSNLGRSIQYYKELFDASQNTSLKFIFSFHRENISSENFFTKYYTLAEEYGIDKFTLIYMVHNQKCMEIFKENIKQYPDMKYKIAPIFGSDNILELNPDIKQTSYNITDTWLVCYKDDQYYSINHKYHKKSVKYFLCPSFDKLLIINEDGALKHCITSNEKTYLYYNTPNIYEIIKKKPYIMCKEDKCLCHVDIPKVKGSHKQLMNMDINKIKELKG